MKRSLCVFALSAGMLSAAALADGLDIGIRNVAGKLQTISVTDEPPNQIFGTEELRVFPVDLTFDAIDSVVKAEEPGLASQDSTVLGRSLRIDILKAARVWNPVTGVFDATSQQLSTGKLPAFPFFNTPATDTTVATNTFVVSDDFHFDWVLNGATSSTGQGIYLVELQLIDTSASGSLASSLPYWAVFNYGLDENEHDAAVDYVANNLVPAPGGVLLAATGLAFGLRRRRPAAA